MALTQSRKYNYILLNGGWVRALPGVTITNSLDGLNQVAEFQLVDRPATTPAFDQTLVISYVDLDTMEGLPVFSGVVNAPTVESMPYNNIIRGVGPLRALKAVRTGTDLDLSGQTDGEAIQTILTACGITFTPADIDDAGYVLGAQAPIYWAINQSAQSVIEAIDRVFGSKTLECYDGRVIRIFYDLAPSTGSAYRTYTKGSDIDIWQLRYDYGDDEERQSYWRVTGPQVDCGDNCNCVVWAVNTGSGPRLGKRVREQETSEFQSDIIQDESLAAAVGDRLMRWYNRRPQKFSATVANDVYINPGTVINVVDPTYGIEHDTAQAYTVVSITRNDQSMTLDLIGGAAGGVGSQDTGVEKMCNDTQSDVDIPGSFTGFPGTSFPPLPSMDPFTFNFPDFDLPGGPGLEDYGSTSDSTPGTADDLLAPAWVPIWVTNDNDVWGPTPTAGSWAFNGTTGVATVEAIFGPYLGFGTQATLRTGVPANTDQWTLRAVGSYTGAIQSFIMQVIDNTGGALFVQDVSLEFADGADRVTEFITTADLHDPTGVTLSGAFVMSIIKDGDTFTAVIEQPSGSVIYSHTIAGNNWGASASGDDLEVLLVGWTNGAGGTLTLTELGLTVGTPSPLWTSEFGTWSINGATLVETSGFGHAYYTGPGAAIDGSIASTWNQIVLEADVTLEAAADNQEFCSFYLEDATNNLASLEVWGPSTTDPGAGIWIYSFNGLGYLDSNTGAVPTTQFHLICTWDKAGGTFDVSFVGNITTTLSGALGSPSGAVTLRIASENDSGATGTYENVTVTIT